MTLQSVRTLARKRPDQEFVLNRLYGAHLSPYATVICLRLGLSPDQVTMLGGALGLVGVALLFLPISWWSVVAVVCLQLGYVLDFSDGQVARLTGRTSVAGSYLDWLTHFYIPVGMAFAAAASVAWATQSPIFLVLGTIAALELAAFAFSCKEHVLIAMQRDDPTLGATAAFHAALKDDARPADVEEAPPGAAVTAKSTGIAGRSRPPSLRSTVAEVLIYPGSVHLMTLAVIIDLILTLSDIGLGTVGRGLLLAVWAAVFPLHVASTVRRNHQLIRAVEQRARSRD